MAKLMITGAAGKIGTALRARFREHELRLTDINELPEPLTSNETFERAPLADQAALTDLAEGTDCVVHLGGLLVNDGFAETAAANIMGTYHALEATRAAGVNRFFYASSNHAVGYTPVAEIDPRAPVDRIAIRPDGYYGVTKVAAEGLCALFADDYGMTILSARILTFGAEPRSLRELSTWISPDDTARLVLATLTIQTPGHHVCWGVSRNTRGWANLADGEAIGFDPKDDSEPWAEQIIAASTDADRERLIAVGGRVAPGPRLERGESDPTEGNGTCEMTTTEPAQTTAGNEGFTYGAVYFRKTNPPAPDWERDYQTARADGFTSFRHWFMWAAVEVARGEYDWADYDKQLELAAANGMTTIIAEHVAIAPEWAFRAYPDGRYERADGSKIDAQMQVSCSIGGAPGLCLDNEDVRQAGEAFLRELVTRYHKHPGTGGYDVWNECNVSPDVCYCQASRVKFREWLKRKYGADVRALSVPWGRFYSSWDDVQPPGSLGIYGQSIDWLLFRRDRAHELMRWRVALIKSIDDQHPVTAHGVAGTLGFGIEKGIDDWEAAAAVDSFGFTFVASRRGDKRWKQPLAVELVRSASGNKQFWHAEAQAGPLWLQPQVTGRPLDDGRVSTPEDIRYWNLLSMAGGATGLFYPRWRPLLDGPLFGAFGAYGMDGSRTDRSRMVAEIATWATDSANDELWAARPAPAPLSLLFVPESQAFGLIARHSRKPYERAITGAWRAFFDLGITADIRKVHQLEDVSVAYLPFPTLLPDAAAAAIKRWVEQGGTLVCEGTPAWFNDHAHASPTQPGAGLAELFGTGEVVAEFTPDILEDLRVRGNGYYAYGGEVKQRLAPTSGIATGWYDDGGVAVVDHQFGAGRTRLIGTMPGTGYSKHEDSGTRDFFAEVLTWAGVTPDVIVGDPRLVTRVHVGPEADFLWILNPTRRDIESSITLGAGRKIAEEFSLRWGYSGSFERVDATTARVHVQARDGLIVRLPR